MINLFILSSNIPSDTIQYLQNINDNIDAVRRIVDVSNSTIANEISAVNTMLVAFTIVFGIVGVLLGVYISWLQRKVSRMSDNIEEKEQKIILLAKTVEDTDKKIQSDISGLYAQLRKEETMSLLLRLEKEPEDIANLGDLLLARSLDETGFLIMKRAFMKLIAMGPDIYVDGFARPSYWKQYAIQFFQHYLRQSILDDDLRPEIVNGFNYGMACAYKSDIIKSTEDLCLALCVGNAPFDKVALLADYLKALNQSRFSNLVELKNIFEEKVNKDILVEAIDRCTTDEVYLGLFGVEIPEKPLETNNSEMMADNAQEIKDKKDEVVSG